MASDRYTYYYIHTYATRARAQAHNMQTLESNGKPARHVVMVPTK